MNGEKTKQVRESEQAEETSLGPSVVSQPRVESAPEGGYAALQSSYGNAAVAHTLIQRKAEGEEVSGGAGVASQTAASPDEAQGAAAPTITPTQALIVEDTAETVTSEQMKKSEFLARLRVAVSSTTAEALAGTPWSEAGCPYIELWFAFYASQSSEHIERAIRRYAPETTAITSANGFIPIITGRVRRAVSTWATTGEITGVPGGVPLGLPGGGVVGAVSGAISTVANALSGAVAGAGSALSSIGNLSFKERDGGAREGGDPEAIQSQLGAGKSLEGDVRSRMESAFGESFSDVQVHADTNAAELSENLNARAFTVGQHVAFGTGEYQPGTLIGEALIAHELAHVMQQRGAGTAGGVMHKGHHEDSELEEAADVAAVGAVVSAWGGAQRGLTRVRKSAMSNLKSGLKLQRCKSKEQKAKEAEIKRLAGLQSEFLEERRKKIEEDKRREAEEAAKKRGEVNPKIEIKVTTDDVINEEVKKTPFVKGKADPWEKDISQADRDNYINVRAPKAWKDVVASVKGTELEKVIKGKNYRFEPKKILEEGWFAYQDNNDLVFGMSWVQGVEADPKNAWPNLAHEMGGHFEYGTPYASEIVNEALNKLPAAERDKWRTDPAKRKEFYERYEYPETEIYAALREKRYSDPVTGPKPAYGGLRPEANIPDKLARIKDALHPEVAKAVLKELKRRVDASAEILDRDKKYYVEQVKLVFGYEP